MASPSDQSRNERQMPRDERGWHVAPAPDGRGMPAPPPTRPPHRARGFVWFLAILLAFNFASVLLIRPAGQPRVKVPFSPYFVTQVRHDRVASIASKGDTIQGTLKVAARIPGESPQIQPTTLFS